MPSGGGSKGFTLAEVLITLGIIGVVAAMTIPTLIANYKEKVYITGAKKLYNQTLNAVNKYCAENGTIGDYSSFWVSNSNNADGGLIALASELNAVKVCARPDNLNECGGKYNIKQYKKLNNGTGKTEQFEFLNRNRMVLADGSFVSVFNEANADGCTHSYFSSDKDKDGNNIPDPSSPYGFKGEIKYSSNCGFIAFDINGLKGPNQVGKDVFQYNFSPNKTNDFSPDYNGNLRYVLANDKLIKTENYTIGDFKKN